jgi:hypothetical protein
MECLTFITVCKSSRTLTFFGSFLLFSKLIQTQHKMLRLKHPYRIFEVIFFAFLALLANFKATIGQNCSKNKKNVFYKCVIESYLTSITVLAGSILSKRSKSLYLNVHISYMTKVFFVVHDHLSSFPFSTI